MRPLILLPVLAGCTTSVAVPAAAGWLEVDDALALGPTALDQSSISALELRNPGTAALSVSGVLDGAAAFELLTPGPWTVPAAGAATLEIRFTPPDGQTQTAGLVLTPDPAMVFAQDAAPVTVGLSGEPDPDADGDGALHTLAGGDDCDDRDAAVHPGAEELWYDGTDQDCDGVDDDQDGDGVALREDCDDTDAAVYPGASDQGFDGKDGDCDGLVDEDAVAALAGAVVVNEVLAESAWTDADYGLYVEVLNVGAEPLVLDGWRLGDGADAGRLGVAVTLEPGALALLCAESDEDLNHGLPCDAVVAPWPDPALGRLELFAPVLSDRGVESDQVLIDEVAWDVAWPLSAGASMQLDPARAGAVENDDPASWCGSTEGAEESDLGTPGAANECP